MSLVGILVGALVALIVYLVGIEITPSDVDSAELIWFIVALLVWGAFAFSGITDRWTTRR